MQPTVYINARGEQVMPLSVFSQLNSDAIRASLLPAKPHVRRKARRIANWSVKA